MLDALHATRDWLDALPHIKSWLIGAWLAYLAGLGVWIVLQKREPAATLSWLLSLAALPYIGFLIYFLLGPQKIKRQRLRRGHARSGMETFTSVCAPDVDCTELARLGQAVTGLPATTATEVRWLVDGSATYAALLGDIAKARRQVHLEYYIFADDRTGRQLRDALVERASAGVMVKVLVDAVGSSTLHASFFAPLVAAGGEFAWFHPTRLRLFTRPWVNLRCHRKIAIIDGHIGYTGGINVTDDENDALRGDAYRDLHMRLEGDIVRSLQLVFVEDWVYATGQKPGTFHVMDTWPAGVPKRGDGHIQAQALVSGPDTSWEAIHRMHVAAIHEARQRVWLVTPYFVPGEAARMALSSAALGGLDVRLLVPRMSDSRMVTLAARSYYEELLAAGVRVFEYGPRMLHTKALLTDDDLCLVGSANFDQRSFRLNFELSVMLRDARVVQALAQHLQGEMSASREVTTAGPGRVLLRKRLPEAFARLLSPLL